jgi:hypothetical protein
VGTRRSRPSPGRAHPTCRVALGVTLVAATAIILLNPIADLALLALDPRGARGGRRGVARAALGRAA